MHAFNYMQISKFNRHAAQKKIATPAAAYMGNIVLLNVHVVCFRQRNPGICRSGYNRIRTFYD
jgi:hypothetical protein